MSRRAALVDPVTDYVLECRRGAVACALRVSLGVSIVVHVVGRGGISEIKIIEGLSLLEG